MTYVLSLSVAVKWLIPETLRANLVLVTVAADALGIVGCETL
jgi:hypothetical protein